LKHPDNDAYWRRWSIRGHYKDITVPALNFDGWYDIFINGALRNFNGMRKQGGSKAARDGTRLVVGPWPAHPLVADGRTDQLRTAGCKSDR
jgi:predicted acyl esterase